MFTPAGARDREVVDRARHVIGDPAHVRTELDELVARTGADELMVSTMVHGHAERLDSYRLVADEMIET